jgi:hypothetical protein
VSASTVSALVQISAGKDRRASAVWSAATASSNRRQRDSADFRRHDPFLDAPHHIGEKRVPHDSRQCVETDDRNTDLAAHRHRAKIDPEVFAGIRVRTIYPVTRQKRQRDMRERINIPRIGNPGLLTCSSISPRR